MRLQWLTDLHLDFLQPGQRAELLTRLRDAAPDALLITGDTAESTHLSARLQELADGTGKPVYFVLGNHDFYRSTIAAVRQAVAQWDHPLLHYLPARGPVRLAPDAVLLGVDGWGDGQLGRGRHTSIRLNDQFLIGEFLAGDVFDRLQALGQHSAELLERQFPLRDAAVREVHVATHVPPFHEACWHEGRLSDEEWLPHFTCHAVGEVLRRHATLRPDIRFHVYCGHTHSEGCTEIAPNLIVWTGGSEYGAVRLQPLIEIG
jgi:DNA repair exonuclease SbcCD nuclease subunit